jgi:signal transduction histidine kinase
LRRRILLAILLAVAVTGAALGIPLGYTALTVVESLTREDLAERAQQIATALDSDLADGRQPDLANVRYAVPEDGRVTLNMRVTGNISYGASLGANVVTEVAPVVRGGKVTVSIPAGPMHTRQMQATGFVVLLVVFSVGIGTLVATVTARRLAEPLRHVADRAAKLGAGDFRPEPARYDVQELDMVAQALDSSATAVADLVQRERDLVGDVSHQLRSRLTALQLRLEGLATHPDPDAASEASAAMEQADRLTQVLDELLAGSRAARAGTAGPVELSSELEKIAKEWREPLRAEGRSLRVKVPTGMLARATPTRLREAIGVLLDNALRHGEGAVTVSARAGDATVVIEVTDSGAGVPDELAAHVFERGVSGGGSTGVGLALARALVDADGGRLELSAARPATFAVFLRMPKADDVLAGSRPPSNAPR